MNSSSHVSSTRPERAEAHSPGQRPGVIMDASLSPCKGKSFTRIRQFSKLLPLQGALLTAIIPRALPWAMSFWAFSPYLNRMRYLSIIDLTSLCMEVKYKSSLARTFSRHGRVKASFLCPFDLTKTFSLQNYAKNLK